MKPKIASQMKSYNIGELLIDFTVLLIVLGALSSLSYVVAFFRCDNPSKIPLPNGYVYSPDHSRHLIYPDTPQRTEFQGQSRFEFVNRLHTGKRYLVIETVPNKTIDNIEELKFKYTIIDTQEHISTGELSKEDYEQQIEALGISRSIRFSKRSHRWWRNMCFLHKTESY